MKTLKQLYKEHIGKVSDKWGSYIDRYDEVFAPYRDKPIRLLEIGVQNGGSLEIWAKYFDCAQLIGCDIDKRCDALDYGELPIAIHVGDSKTINLPGIFDIIIDDGSHTSNDIIQNFKHFWNSLNDGGLYIIEDLHCSYWPPYQDSTVSSMDFLKTLTDSVNAAFHGGESKEIKRIEFNDSLCIIWKGRPDIGERLIVGNEKII